MHKSDSIVTSNPALVRKQRQTALHPISLSRHQGLEDTRPSMEQHRHQQSHHTAPLCA